MKNLSWEEYLHLFKEEVIEKYYNIADDFFYITKNWKNEYKLYKRFQWINKAEGCNAYKLILNGKKEIEEYIKEKELKKIII